MTIEAPYPELDEILTLIGEAGHRLSEIEATEGAAGNISVYMGWPMDPRRRFPIEEPVELPEPAPELAGKAFLVTGSGRRLREIIEAPAANLGCVVVQPGGAMGTLHTAPGRLFARLTSEWNSHLAVHRDYIARSGTNFHAIVHAQPLHLTYLSHVPRYQDTGVLSRRLLRWQPESIVNLPEEIGFIPFALPGSPELMAATVEGLRRHRIVVWAKHGVMARSDISVKRAGDRIEYAETGARYEYMNLVNGEQGTGLTAEEVRAICAAFDIKQTIF
jgi:rhamnulose-1-phosphate aldolase